MEEVQLRVHLVRVRVRVRARARVRVRARVRARARARARALVTLGLRARHRRYLRGGPLRLRLEVRRHVGEVRLLAHGGQRTVVLEHL